MADRSARPRFRGGSWRATGESTEQSCREFCAGGPGGKKADVLAVYVIAALLVGGLAASVRILKQYERGGASRRTSTLAVPPPERAAVPEPV